MPKRFAIGLPNYDQRLKILSLVRDSRPSIVCTVPDMAVWLFGQMLKDTTLSPGFSVPALAELSEGQSGSDLKEMCRNAAMVPVREYVRGAGADQEVLAKGQLEVWQFRI